MKKYNVVPEKVLWAKIEWTEGASSSLYYALESMLDPHEHIIECTYEFDKGELKYFAAYTSERYIKMLSKKSGKSLWSKNVTLKH